MPEDSCAAIILAAGSSSRLGKPKQLLVVDGETLLRRTARLALGAGCSPVVVVLGANAEQFQPELRGLEVVSTYNTDWEEGMASSLRRGMEEIGRWKEKSANVLILVCDQVRLTLPILVNLLAKHRSSKANITASSYSGTKGVPAVFSQEIFTELAVVRGDEGARRIIARYPALDPALYPGHIEIVDFPGGGDDLDAIEDLGNAAMHTD